MSKFKKGDVVKPNHLDMVRTDCDGFILEVFEKHYLMNMNASGKPMEINMFLLDSQYDLDVKATRDKKLKDLLNN